ncbi:MAG TPA: rhomboid family intramembrane serine protease [Actinomycetota bacterium]
MPDDQFPAPPPPPPAPTVEVCYRHPDVATRVHCTRCGRPICPDCMIQAPVGFQCPECVEQARRQFRVGPVAAARGLGVTRVLLVAIVAMYVLELVSSGGGSVFGQPSGGRLIELGALQPLLIADGQFWRLFSAMFLHASLFHILFNGYALWLFGSAIESNLGRTNMALVYFVSGFVASAASYAFLDARGLSVGASGAIFGIFGAFIAYNYRRRHLAVASANLRWAGILLLLNAFLALGYRAIDWRAHLGGLAAGFVAGWVAEGWGAPAQRRIIRVVGFGALVALGIGLVVWRTGELRNSALFGSLLD